MQVRTFFKVLKVISHKKVYFDINYTSRAEFLSEHRRVIKSRLASSVNEICESRARSREELQNLYRRIVSYILLESGLGSPTDIAIVKVNFYRQGLKYVWNIEISLNNRIEKHL